jgi:hypothetical protein
MNFLNHTTTAIAVAGIVNRRQLWRAAA